MCGIVGYVGHRTATEFLLEGLRRLEYRGYDSAGIVTSPCAGQLDITKTVGRIEKLAEQLQIQAMQGHIGIGHTRWATHGPPTEWNAHPHFGGERVLAIAHNGVIENYQILKDRLIEQGYSFNSQTDSEVIAHLIDSSLQLRIPELRAGRPAPRSHAGNGSSSGRHAENGSPAGEESGAEEVGLDVHYAPLIAAVEDALKQLHGTYGLVVMFRDYPDVMIAARLGSPLVIGIGDREHFVASDPSPLAGFTDQIVYLADHQLAVLTANAMRVSHRDEGHIAHAVETLQFAADDLSLQGYPHYMLKEIFEQPESLRDAMRGRISEDDATAVFGGLNLSVQQLRTARRVILTACGTSWHAGLVGEYLIESMARLPVEVEYASELRYRNPPVDMNTILFAITQSGETADTLAALREMKRKGYPTLAICNVVGSTIAQEADGGIYLHAGPEIGVASTKAYTSQLMVLTLLGLYFGRLHHLSYEQGRQMIEALHRLPDKVAEALETNDEVRRVAGKYCHANNFLYLGRQFNFPTALEGALKLKEISYIHAEGYPAAEMKHGPIALVDEDTPSVFIVPQDFVYDKVMANLEEIKARGGPVIAVVGEGDTRVARLADDVIYVPQVEDYLQPFVTIVPLQLLSYHIAVLRGCDVDKPRNLAKSVTVE